MSDLSIWDHPHEVSDVDVAFPARGGELVPLDEEIPEVDPKWLELQRRWFYEGLPGQTEFHCVEGVDGEKAFRHLAVVNSTYAIKHEHKERAFAYLASRWFTDVVIPEETK